MPTKRIMDNKREEGIKEQKKCSKCKVLKEINEFYKDKSAKDGYAWWCKVCRGDYLRKYFVSDKHRAYRRMYQKQEAHRSYQRKYQKQEAPREYRRKYAREHAYLYKDEKRARYLARMAKDEIKKDFCEDCGIKDRLHMHHEDYSKPLEVITLCILCHEKRHHYAVTT